MTNKVNASPPKIIAVAHGISDAHRFSANHAYPTNYRAARKNPMEKFIVKASRKDRVNNIAAPVAICAKLPSTAIFLRP